MYNSHFLSMIKTVTGLTARTITAGGTGDGVAQNGTSIDRQDIYSAIVAVPITAVLAATETATVNVKVQDSADNSTFADFASATELVLTGDTGGSTETDIIQLKVNLQGAKRYMRVVVTCDLSATGTDTATFAAVVALTGAIENPLV